MEVVGNNNIFYANSIAPKAILNNSLIVSGSPISNANQQPDTGIALGNTQEDSSYNIFYKNNFIGSDYFPILVWSGVHGPEYFDNGTLGNYWSNYNGTDSNADGIGDTPNIMYTNDPQNNNNRTSPNNIANFVLTDNYPLMSQVNIASISIQIPPWAIPSMINPPTQVSFPAFETPTRTSAPLSPSPTQNVPELSGVAILPLLVATIFIAIRLKRRMQ